MKKEKKVIQLITDKQPVLLYCYKNGCSTLTETKTKLKQLEKSYGDAPIKVLHVEVEKIPNLVSDWEIEGAPAVLLFQEGEEKWRKAGKINEKQILFALDQYCKN